MKFKEQKKCIILANGKSPKKSVITFFQRKGYNKLICADGGANSALQMGLFPNVIIGDLDSISAKALKEYKSFSKIIRLKRQNDTDVEKCLKYAISKNFDEVLLVGVTGNRLDHTFCNIGIILKFFPKIKLSMIAENSFLKPYERKITLRTFPGETISIYGFDQKTKISAKGLKYPLKNIALPFGERESTSNITSSDKVELKINGGVIFVIRDLKLMIANDLF